MERDKRTLIAVVAVLAAVAVPVRLRVAAQDQQPAKTKSGGNTPAPAHYNFLIGSGLLCDADVSACPAVAAAANQETIEISGAGTLDLPGKSVAAAGAFVQKTPERDIVVTGVWTATELVSFESYGVAPAAMLADHPTLRTPGPFPMGKIPAPMAAMMGGPMAAGGLAVIRIHLLPDAGSPSDAVLQVNCAKGRVPEEAQSDGVRLTITGGLVFDQQVAGRTVFLLRRPGPNPAWKSSATAGPQS